MLQAADIVIRLNPADDVVIARIDIPEGTMLLRDNVQQLLHLLRPKRVGIKIACGQPRRAKAQTKVLPYRKAEQNQQTERLGSLLTHTGHAFYHLFHVVASRYIARLIVTQALRRVKPPHSNGRLESAARCYRRSGHLPPQEHAALD